MPTAIVAGVGPSLGSSLARALAQRLVGRGVTVVADHADATPADTVVWLGGEEAPQDLDATTKATVTALRHVLALLPARLLVGSGAWSKLGFSVLFVGSPVFFAALSFASLFREREQAATAFGWNLLGAVAGGLLEFASMALGLKGVCIIGHGSSSARAIVNAVGVARDMVERELVAHIREAVAFGLRMVAGVACTPLRERYCLDPIERFREPIERLTLDGWILSARLVDGELRAVPGVDRGLRRAATYDGHAGAHPRAGEHRFLAAPERGDRADFSHRRTHRGSIAGSQQR